MEGSQDQSTEAFLSPSCDLAVLPYHYMHALDSNSCVEKLVVGPTNYVLKKHERVACYPAKFITLTKSQYCVISNPILRNEDGNVIQNPDGSTKLSLDKEEYRYGSDQFPLYPGEVLKVPETELPILNFDTALHLRALEDFVDGEATKAAGEEWLFEGPAVYYPRREVEIVSEIKAHIVDPNTALKFAAIQECVDRSGIRRQCGDEWLVTKSGAYLPTVHEKLAYKLTANLLNEKNALHVQSLCHHVDCFGKDRKCGDEWLITWQQTASYICEVEQAIVKSVRITSLTQHDYCVILNPVDDDGKPQFGEKKLVRGPTNLFLRPGETLQNGVEKVHILGPNEGLVLQATQKFLDGRSNNARVRQPGDRWMILGPTDYVPPVEVKIIDRRTAIPLSSSEGIYVRDTLTGNVRSVVGQAYMLTENEEHWKKILPPDVQELLSDKPVPFIDRSHYEQLHIHHLSCLIGMIIEPQVEAGPYPVVSLHVPHNAVVQIYDYKCKTSRVEFGPILVLLEPYEKFTVLSLSGGLPKEPNKVKSLYLLLGPDYFTDLVTVDTADHAQLSLELSYNWMFDTNNISSSEEAAKLFCVPDFVGDACKSMASRIRSVIAQTSFDQFHKNSARIIRSACMGLDDYGRIPNSFTFSQNRLLITNVDIRAVSPIDRSTMEQLARTVQIAIEITTNSQEATARHEAARIEQQAKSRLERQRIQDDVEAEMSRKKLLELKVEAAALESTGQAKAEAMARAETQRIECESAVELAKLTTKEQEIKMSSELDRQKQLQVAELKHLESVCDHDLDRQKKESEIDVHKFVKMIGTLGSETISKLATAGSSHDVHMLQALGLESALITDGSAPVNLVNTASGLIGKLLPT